LRSAEAALQVATYELEQARAALGRLTGPARAALETAELRAPIDGAILRIGQESEGPVAAGTPILELGDLSQLEVVVDLLTQDAVRVQPGAKVAVERWGGQQPLAGRVRLVEPSAFTKLSALGVEEQRVNVVVALDRPPAQLGDGFRVECRITLLSAPDVLQVPAGALFRRETGEWMVFAANGGRLRLRPVPIVELSDEAAQVAGGVAAGDRVVLHPGDKVRDGVRWEPLAAIE
jgi:HlyD family secretion protein